jgi:hypothetical protein
MHLMTMKNTMDSMMMIELHSYIGAFRPTDKVRPGFRDRYGTLYVLTHSKPYNKKFVIIPTKNITLNVDKTMFICVSPLIRRLIGTTMYPEVKSFFLHT